MQFGSNTLVQWTSLLSANTPSHIPRPPRPPPPLTWADRVARGLTPVRHPLQVPDPTFTLPPLHPPSPPSLPASLHLSFHNPLSPPSALLPPAANAHQSPNAPSSTFIHSTNPPVHTALHSTPPSEVKLPTDNISTLNPCPSRTKSSSPPRQRPNSPDEKPTTTSSQPPHLTEPIPAIATKFHPTKPPSFHTPDPQISQSQPYPQPPQSQPPRSHAKRPHSTNPPNGYAQAAKQHLAPLPKVAQPPVQAARPHPAQTQASRPATANSQMTWSQHARLQPAQLQEVRAQVAKQQNAKRVEGRDQDIARRPSTSGANGDVVRPTKQLSSDNVRTLSISPASSSARLKVAPTKRRQRPPRASPEDAVVVLPPRALRGLVNCGNSCFTNVVLQALMACEPFRRLVLQCEKAGIGKTDGLVHKFVRLVREMTGRGKVSYEDGEVNGVVKNGHRSKGGSADVNGWSATGNGSKSGQYGAKGGHTKGGASESDKKRENELVVEEPLLADWFYDVFPGSGPRGTNGASGGSQEDAEEFLSFVLNGLHEELVELNKEANSSSDWEGSSNSSDLTENGAGYAKADSRGKEKMESKSSMKVNGAWNGWHDEVDDGVWEEMTRKGRTVEVRGGSFAESGITDIFGGVLRSEVKRGRAKPSVTKEPFFRLSLDIESGMIRDVEHALSAYFEPEQVEGYEDGDEEEIVEMRKQVSLQEAPQVLVLHLKRFSHNSVTGALTKVSRMMPFPEILELPAQAGHGAGGKCYALTAVATHIGKELAGGHYTCDVRWEGDSWVSCDDSKVSRTTVGKVLQKQAYLLFYSLQTRRKANGERAREGTSVRRV